MTVPELPLICNKPRIPNFRSWRLVESLRDEGGFQEAVPQTPSIPEHPSICHSRKALLSSPGCRGSTGGCTQGAALTPGEGCHRNAAGTAHPRVTTRQPSSYGRNFPPSPFSKPQCQSRNSWLQQLQRAHSSSNFFSFEIIKSTLQNILFGMILKNSKQSKLLSFFKKNRLNSLIPAMSETSESEYIFYYSRIMNP